MFPTLCIYKEHSKDNQQQQLDFQKPKNIQNIIRVNQNLQHPNKSQTSQNMSKVLYL